MSTRARHSADIPASAMTRKGAWSVYYAEDLLPAPEEQSGDLRSFSDEEIVAYLEERIQASQSQMDSQLTAPATVVEGSCCLVIPSIPSIAKAFRTSCLDVQRALMFLKDRGYRYTVSGMFGDIQ